MKTDFIQPIWKTPTVPSGHLTSSITDLSAATSRSLSSSLSCSLFSSRARRASASLRACCSSSSAFFLASSSCCRFSSSCYDKTDDAMCFISQQTRQDTRRLLGTDGGIERQQESGTLSFSSKIFKHLRGENKYYLLRLLYNPGPSHLISLCLNMTAFTSISFHQNRAQDNLLSTRSANSEGLKKVTN